MSVPNAKTLFQSPCVGSTSLLNSKNRQSLHLSVRSKKQVPTVSVGLLLQDARIELDAARDPRRGFEEGTPDNKVVYGEAVILYGQSYNIQISSYSFALVWRSISSTPQHNNQRLAELAEATCKQSLSLLRAMGSREMPTGADLSELLSHRITRPRTSKHAVVRENKQARRLIGEGAFGKVYISQDEETSAWIGIKVIQLRKVFKNDGFDINRARAIFHRELRVMQSTNHANIIQYLGYGEVDTMEPEIIMPFCAGSLENMSKLLLTDKQHQETCWAVLEQMLCALDYLASLGYAATFFNWPILDSPTTRSSRKRCAAPSRTRPPNFGRVFRTSCRCSMSRAIKMDAWSLYAAFVALLTKMKRFPPRSAGTQEQFYNLSRNTLLDSVKTFQDLAPMAVLEPERRASAAWMLHVLFEGRGLTTKPGKTEPYYPPGNSPRRPQPVQPPPRQWSSRMDIDDPPAVSLSRPVTRQGGRLNVHVPLIVHSRAVLDRRDAQLVQQKIRKQGGGVVKRRSKPRHPVTIR
ncbi:kinase-like domain-containing protein [Colletotrichum godetiae]|uniref:Kinase-like domain-containing protein n=1 Tax=Colletotrichum godetiae TaxID=1209918 RepID=A0AAJ0AFZ0_9PEZI|nr:kinase-like domain-containing protein [Colletotrichum godetiae]KAK1673185.1 kinase-like domain-containing protein [Colletotrichum godetiae]